MLDIVTMIQFLCFVRVCINTLDVLGGTALYFSLHVYKDFL